MAGWIGHFEPISYVIVYKFRRNLRGLISLFIFIVGNLSNNNKKEMQLPVKLIFGQRERINFMKEIWECPAHGIESGTIHFVEVGKG